MKGFYTQGELNSRQQEQQVRESTPVQTRDIHIYGYKEWYLPHLDVDVYLDGEKKGTIPYKGHLTVEIDNNNHYFEFHWNKGLGFVKKCHCFINNKFVGGLQLVTNRFLGIINVEYTM